MVEWSYDSLDEAARRVFDRLSVFVNGFDLEAAEAVAANAGVAAVDLIDILDELVAKSMVIAEPAGTDMRYRLLETLRSYGHDRLVAADTLAEARRAHAEHYARWLTRVEQAIKGRDGADLIPVVVREFDNLRTAMQAGLDLDDPSLAVRILARCDPLVYLSGASTLGPISRVVIDAMTDAAITPDLVGARMICAALALFSADETLSMSLAADAALHCDALGIPPPLHAASISLVSAASWRADPTESARWSEWLLDWVHRAADPFGGAVVLVTIAAVARAFGRPEEARLRFAEAEAMASALDNRFVRAFVSGLGALSAIEDGDHAAAIPPLRAALDEPSISGTESESHLRRFLARALLGLGLFTEAAAELEGCEDLHIRIGSLFLLPATLSYDAELLTGAGRGESAAQVLGWFRSAKPELYGTSEHFYGSRLHRIEATLEATLGRARLDELMAAGGRESLDSIRTLARTERRAIAARATD